MAQPKMLTYLKVVLHLCFLSQVVSREFLIYCGCLYSNQVYYDIGTSSLPYQDSTSKSLLLDIIHNSYSKFPAQIRETEVKMLQYIHTREIRIY